MKGPLTLLVHHVPHRDGARFLSGVARGEWDSEAWIEDWYSRPIHDLYTGRFSASGGAVPPLWVTGSRSTAHLAMRHPDGRLVLAPASVTVSSGFLQLSGGKLQGRFESKQYWPLPPHIDVTRYVIFQLAMEADPDDEAPRLIFADWLYENGYDAEAEKLLCPIGR
jgi:uncharacterized protein (TIGR02996 family)